MLRIPSVELDPKYIKSRLSYDPESGELFWISRDSLSCPIHVGDKAGSVNHQGYVVIGLGGITVLAHRLAFVFMTGDFPPIGKDIDHLNRNRADNRWPNLRLVTRSENIHNGVAGKHTVSKRKGVRFSKRQRKWIARITIEKRTFNLGSFDTEDAAVAARIKAESENNLICYGGN